MAVALQVYKSLLESISIEDLIKPLLFISSQVLSSKLPTGITKQRMSRIKHFIHFQAMVGAEVVI